MTDESGVAAPEGYRAETGTMARESQKIHDEAESAQDEVKDLETAEVAETDFGKAHTQWGADFATAIAEIGKGANGMCASLLSLAGAIGSAGEQYEAAEAEQSATAAQSGSGM
ncbi:hypothetical protein [Saccharomonospora sp.]|uniref:hypothetical protein n=1 Tax=Saccharomonospora sp. TaxID=33913 RepID=UPI0026207B54|nr:hypothetical protein [Saccharomonospora sp.]